MTARTLPRAEAAARTSLDRAVAHAVSIQAPAGWWKGELETNVTMDAEDLLLRAFLGILDDRELVPAAAWIRSQQREDGTWSNFFGGPGNLSTTAEAYAALRLAGDPADATHMEKARAFVLDAGGLERTRVFTRLWMALFGLWPWEELPALPPELIFFPRWFPFNVYDWACWARQTLVPLTIVGSFRPVRPLSFGLDELRTGAPRPAPLPVSTWGGRFEHLDRWLHAYERHPNRRLREAARTRGIEWIVRRQEADGSWGGIQPPWVYSILALDLMGYGLDHPVTAKAIQGIEGFTVWEDGTRRLEACQSPVWDTALAVIGLSDAGLAPDHPALTAAGRWILDEEIRVPGDWTVNHPGMAPGGWAFEFANDHYPDIDDTAEVVMALRRIRHEDDAAGEAAVRRGVEWLRGMQSSDGGWAAFDADNTRELAYELPFCDFGAVIDPPSADVTAHAVEMLSLEGMAGDVRTRRGLAWLERSQEPDGSWFGRWGANYVYGTGAAIPAAILAGVPASDPRLRRAVAWLERVQNPDGGWGEDLRSYDDPATWKGRGESTASQTAWALIGLLAAGERESTATQRGVAWLASTQRADGTWDEPWYTGAGFPRDFYINYHLYRLVFPLQALGRYVHGWNPPRGGGSS
jgi:squalene-hopene/tetraprenyl-beta-curcumene cyclase